MPVLEDIRGAIAEYARAHPRRFSRFQDRPYLHLGCSAYTAVQAQAALAGRERGKALRYIDGCEIVRDCTFPGFALVPRK